MVFFFISAGLSSAPSALEMISRFFNFGRIRAISSSRSKWPRSTHCNTAMAVMSLIQEAMDKIVSGSIALAAFSGFVDRYSIAFEYSKVPTKL